MFVEKKLDKSKKNKNSTIQTFGVRICFQKVVFYANYCKIVTLQ